MTYQRQNTKKMSLVGQTYITLIPACGKSNLKVKLYNFVQVTTYVHIFEQIHSNYIQYLTNMWQSFYIFRTHSATFRELLNRLKYNTSNLYHMFALVEFKMHEIKWV